MLGLTQSCERGSHLNPHCNEHQDLEDPSIKLCIRSLAPSNLAEQTSLSYSHYPLSPHLKGIFFLAESKTGRDVNVGAEHAQKFQHYMLQKVN